MKQPILIGIALLTFGILASCKNTAKLKSSSATAHPLTGTWVLNYITGPRITFEGLYPDKKPQLVFTDNLTEVRGNSSCNGFNAPVKIDQNSINFGDARSTRMACPGAGESTFMNMLPKINRYSISDDSTLTLIMGDIAMMRFSRQH